MAQRLPLPKDPPHLIPIHSKHFMELEALLQAQKAVFMMRATEIGNGHNWRQGLQMTLIFTDWLAIWAKGLHVFMDFQRMGSVHSLPGEELV